MKKMITSLVVTSLFTTAALLAQPAGTAPSPENRVARRVSFLTKQLALTPDQQQQATTIFSNAAAAAAPVRANMKTAHESLRNAVKANDVGTINQASSTIGSLTGQLLANRAAAEASFNKILTPDQQTKLAQIHNRVGHRFGRGNRAGSNNNTR